MVAKARVSTVVARQVPEFVREDHKKFVTFMEAYYEFLEQMDQPGFLIRNFKNVRDVDASIESFVDNLQSLTPSAIQVANSLTMLQDIVESCNDVRISNPALYNTINETNPALISAVQTASNVIPIASSEPNSVISALSGIVDAYKTLKKTDPVTYNTMRSLIPAFLTLLENAVTLRGGINSKLQDILDTRKKYVDLMVQQVKGEVAEMVPDKVSVDKKLLVRNINDLYNTKGSTRSYEFLFQMLFNEKPEIYLPKTDILRVSDGKWSREMRLRVKRRQGDPFQLIGNKIEQLESETAQGSSAYVENIIITNYGATEVVDVILNEQSINGTFESTDVADPIRATLSDGTVVKCDLVEVLTNFTISNPGRYYSIGDKISFQGYSGAVPLEAVVGGISTGSIEQLEVIEGGINYEIGDEIIIDNTNTGGAGARAYVNNVTNEGSIISVFMYDGGNGYKSVPSIIIPTYLVVDDLYNYKEGTSFRRDKLNDHTVVNLYSEKNQISGQPNGVFIGTAKIRAAEVKDTETNRYKLTMFDIVMNPPFNFFNDVQQIYIPSLGVTGDVDRTVQSLMGTGAKVIATGSRIGNVTDIQVVQPGYDVDPNLQSKTSVVGIVRDIDGSFITNEPVVSIADSLLLESYDNMYLEQGNTEDVDEDGFLLEQTTNYNFAATFTNIDLDKNIIRLVDATGNVENGVTVRGLISGATARFISVDKFSAVGNPGVMYRSYGKYIGDDGKIGASSKKIQDSKYYQEYSYVIRANQTVDRYRDAVKKLLHPIGMAMFGEVTIRSLLDAKIYGGTDTVSIDRKEWALIVKDLIAAKIQSFSTEVRLSKESNLQILESRLRVLVKESEFLPTIIFPRVTPTEMMLLEMNMELVPPKYKLVLNKLFDYKSVAYAIDQDIIAKIMLRADASDISSLLKYTKLLNLDAANVSVTEELIKYKNLIMLTADATVLASANNANLINGKEYKYSITTETALGPTYGSFDKFKFRLHDEVPNWHYDEVVLNNIINNAVRPYNFAFGSEITITN